MLVRLLGPAAISAEDLKNLRKYGKLPLDQEVSLVEKAFLLGRLRSTTSSKKFKSLTSKDLDKELASANFSEVDKLIIEEARFHAAKGMKRITDEISSGVYDGYSHFLGKFVNEFVVKEAVGLEVTRAVLDQKTAKELAKTLEANLKTTGKDWSRIAGTELHRAKVRGEAAAITQKVGPYAKSDGADSLVSIVPSKDTCADCAHHYVGKDGSPKVFKLRDLIATGSNSDPDVTHERAGKRHASWKTVLPPCHPSCQCSIVYIPPGMGWEISKLAVTDKALYEERLSKAVDKGTMSATITPPGPPQPNKPKAVASIPGVPAPSNMGTSATSAAKPGASGPKITYEYWKGDGQPPAEGGWEQSDSGSWRRPVGSGGSKGAGEKEADPKKKREMDQETAAKAKEWGGTPKAAALVLSHLKEGKISILENLGEAVGEDNAGVYSAQSFRVTIEGNGRGCMKPVIRFDSSFKDSEGNPIGLDIAQGLLYTEGCGTVPHNTQPMNEEGAYRLFSAFGSNLCPPTTSRDHEGARHSVQQWAENKIPVAQVVYGKSGGKKPDFTSIVNLAADPEKFRNSLEEIVTMDLVMNSQDRHVGNLMADFEKSEVAAIDHGSSFGSGMMGFKNQIFRMMASGGNKLKLSEAMQEKFAKTTLGDLTRAMGDTHQDWQIGQAFLRMQYLQHLQDSDGELKYEKFLPFQYRAMEPEDFINDSNRTADRRMWVGTDDDVEKKIKEIQSTPRANANAQWEDFAMDWMDKHAADSSSPHHEAAKKLQETGIFMGPNHAADAAGYRERGLHKDYETKIRKERAEAHAGKKIAPAVKAKQVVDLENEATSFSGRDSRDRFENSKTAAQRIEIQKQAKAADDEEMSTRKAKFGKSLFLRDPHKNFLTTTNQGTRIPS